MPQIALEKNVPEGPTEHSASSAFELSNKKEEGQKKVGIFLGAPNLRTIWNVQSVTVEFNYGIVVSTKLAVYPVKLELSFLAGNRLVSFLIIENNLVVKAEPEIFEFGTKQYVLEVYAPVSLSKAEAIEILFGLNVSPTVPVESKCSLNAHNVRLNAFADMTPPPPLHRAT